MDKTKPDASPTASDEHDQQKTLLSWATARIEQLAHNQRSIDNVGEWLDWMAYFTREHFGFQRRLLNEYGKQREYLLNRVAVHSEFRRKLAQLCVDALRGDPTIPARLQQLCHELLRDAQTHGDAISYIVGRAGGGARVRRSPRRGQMSLDAMPVTATDDGQAAGDSRPVDDTELPPIATPPAAGNGSASVAQRA